MSDNVVPLKTVSTPVAEVDPEVVARCEWLLDHAKAGAMQGLLFVTIESDGAGNVLAVGSSYAGQGVRQNVHASLGGLMALQRRFGDEQLA